MVRAAIVATSEAAHEHGDGDPVRQRGAGEGRGDRGGEAAEGEAELRCRRPRPTSAPGCRTLGEHREPDPAVGGVDDPGQQDPEHEDQQDVAGLIAQMKGQISAAEPSARDQNTGLRSIWSPTIAQVEGRDPYRM